jgi:hypothetical protein
MLDRWPRLTSDLVEAELFRACKRSGGRADRHQKVEDGAHAAA